MKTLIIKLNYPEGFTNEDLKMRYILVDTLEDRGLGQVWGEGSGEGYMEVKADVQDNEETHEAINSILQSLGLISIAQLTYEEIDD